MCPAADLSKCQTATFTERQTGAVIPITGPLQDESRWREIPWQTDLRDACRLAAEARKPIFLWAMNGNPLGCT